jgi:hypothetical protein
MSIEIVDIPTESELFGKLDIPTLDEVWARWENEKTKDKSRVPTEEPHYFFTARKYGKLKLLKKRRTK